VVECRAASWKIRRIMIRALFLTAVLAGSQRQVHAAEMPAAVTLQKSGLPVLVSDSAETTRIDGCFGPLSKTGATPSVTLQIDWLNQTPPATDFKTTFANGIARSSHQLGDTHLTRTVLVSDGVVFLHFLADKPGDISFRATLKSAEPGETIIEDRRQIAWNSIGKPGRKARAWVIPFESDVERDGDSIVLRGEGECLVILDFTDADSPQTPVSQSWARISATRDPGETHPDPTKIWHAVLAEAAKP
jgi:hypothetical protein